MLRCTMKGCRRSIGGKTGLDEALKVATHFQRVHNTPVTLEEALGIRIDMEEGREPNLLRAMLGGDNLPVRRTGP